MRITALRLRFPSPALILSCVALFAALGGGAYAASSLGAGSSGEAWHLVGKHGQPQFQNNWKNYGHGFAPASFYKDPIGIVHLRGAITGGPTLSTAFTLSRKYRPPKNMAFSVAAGTGSPSTEDVDVFSNGQVYVFGPVNSVLTLDGISFRR